MKSYYPTGAHVNFGAYTDVFVRSKIILIMSYELRLGRVTAF
ncbi:hypothetical protein APHWI1_0418 [Anaplasma phagocytophilum str. ApWI1]|nr:hypothetical protein APHWEB_1097 [Anaplasma phagocytophilum str. Webster]KJV85522.1 hypothetical protein APHWI1_0418 [Anaplasma phagocytophilum str. ApWI1]KJV87123.1 hypothetical protein APHNYW_0928 [Anaplasma phagocytophilum str. ApNYW]KJV98276.1 hypothetical protein OTSANNIE_1187 [Anaplasma phagocytophilum str. Annie]